MPPQRDTANGSGLKWLPKNENKNEEEEEDEDEDEDEAGAMSSHLP